MAAFFGALGKYHGTFGATLSAQVQSDVFTARGVDMTTDEPLELTIKKMNRVMDEMEKLLAR